MKYSDSGFITVPASGALAYALRVTINSSGQAVAASDDDKGVGVIITPSAAAGELVTIKLWNAGGTFPAIAAGAAAVGAVAYGAVDGEVNDAQVDGNSVVLGIYLTAAAGDQSQVEIARD